MSKALLLNAAASGAAGASGTVYVDDVFSTYVYSGTGSSQNIINNIDLDGEGGLIWSKRRDNSVRAHILVDSVRGATKVLNSDGNYAEYTMSSMPSSFNSNGYTIGTSDAGVNNSGDKYVSWTFRKQSKFFDIVTYTGNGTAGRTISHNLGSVPGMIIVKPTSGVGEWVVYHRSLGNTKYLHLEQTHQAYTSNARWNDTTPTSTVFTVGTTPTNTNGTTYVAYLFAHTPNSSFLDESAEYYASNSNISGFNGSGQYRIYVNTNLNNTYYNAGSASGSVSGTDKFREIEAAIETATGQKVRTGQQKDTSGSVTFYSIVTLGADSSPVDDEESFITFGSYLGTGSYTRPPVIKLGFEPQWVMIKNTSGTGDWVICDIMRGASSQIVGSRGTAQRLNANSSGVETSYSGGYIAVSPTATGFTMSIDGNEGNGSGNTYIYMAIRRPNKPASEFTATQVFQQQAKEPGEGSDTFISTGFPVDALLYAKTDGNIHKIFGSRLQGGGKTGGELLTDSNSAEGSNSGAFFLDHSTGVTVDHAGGHFQLGPSATDNDYVRYFFRRVPGFFDVVAYTSNTTYPNTFAHNLGAVPELVIVKNRSSAQNWTIYAAPSGNNRHLTLNSTAAESSAGSTFWNSTTPTASVVHVGGQDETWGYSGPSYIALLFASASGISKVGSYTGTGSSQNIDCGFSGGARFVLIKNKNNAGGWLVWDSARGITANNDPFLRIDSNDGNQNYTGDDIDPISSGFNVSSNNNAVNKSGRDYLFLAIA